jgi:hypothetical protein
MSRRLKPRTDSTAKLHRAIAWMRNAMGGEFSGSGSGRRNSNYHPEALESRLMMKTFGTLLPSGGIGPATGVYDFWTGSQVEEIAYNDVAFEAIGVYVNPTTGNAQLGYTPGDPTTTPVLDPADLPQANPIAEPAQGENLYKIYVTQSAADSYISIYAVTGFGTATQAPAPFSGAIPGISVVNAQNGGAYTTDIPGGTGTVLIGALNPVSVPVNQPIASISGITQSDGVTVGTSLGLYTDPTDGQGNPDPISPGIDVIALNASNGTPNNFGNFLIGGTLTGTAFFGGNLNEFYAGAVLTGDIAGDPAVPTSAPTSARTDPNNFFVAGDLREFITNGPVGTDGVGGAAAPQYVTSFDLNVGGKIGEVHIGNSEAGSTGTFAGTIEAGNSPLISQQTAYTTASAANLVGITTPQLEVENLAKTPDSVFELGQIDLRNDTAADAQVLGSIPILNATSGLPQRDASGNIEYEAEVEGNLDAVNGDVTDYYAVAEQAGATFTATLSANNLEIFDPSGREVATNSRSGIGPQQYTADRPGLYYFAVTGGIGQYLLTVTGVGNLAIGGIITTGDFTDIGVDQSVIAGIGDIGAIDVGGTYISTTTGPTPAPTDPLAPTTTSVPLTAPTSILVADGNLRDLQASAIGEPSTNDPTILVDGPYLSVPNGGVGLIESTTGVLNFNSQFDPNDLNLPTPQFVTDDAYASAIGGSIQIISAATIFMGNVATNAGIGTIDAGNMATDQASYIDVNADNKGNDGIIDLIDVTGNIGVLGPGGPGIVTHDGGNVRYMQVGGSIVLPNAFGGLTDNPVTTSVGGTLTLTDDSGATYSVTAEGVVTTTNTSTSTITTGPQVQILTYPVLDHSGLIPISLTAISPSTNNSASVLVTALNASGINAEMDFGTITIVGPGRPIVNNTTNSSAGVVSNVTDAYGNALLTQTVPTVANNGFAGVVGIGLNPTQDPTDEFLDLTGSTKINVLNVSALTTVDGQSPVEVANTTLGEIVNLTTGDAPSASVLPGIGSIVVNGNLGFATPQATPAAVMPIADIPDGNTYPFVQQHTGVTIGTGFVLSDTDPTTVGTVGDVLNIDVGGAAANIDAGGTIQSLITNYAASTGIKGVKPILGQIDGLLGPVLATRVLYVDIGQGMIPSGTGAVGFSGIYGTGVVGEVTNQGNPGGDIRGNIESNEINTQTAIDAVTLVNGSFIDAKVYTPLPLTAKGSNSYPDFEVAEDAGPPFNDSNNGQIFGPNNGPYNYDIGPITVTGDGGIIGSTFTSGSFAGFTVAGGAFGILDSTITGETSGDLASMSVSGYGIRDTSITGFGYIGSITLTGNGSLIPVTHYGLDVRPSDVGSQQLDPYFGFFPDATIDLDAELGVTASTPNIPNVTDTGVLEDDTISALYDFTSLTAQKARTALPINADNVLPDPALANIPVLGQTFANSVTVGDNVGQVHIYQQIDGFQITAGSLGGLSLAANVNRLGISIAGNIAAVYVKGNLGQYITDPATGVLVPDSYIDAAGPSGTISLIKVLGNLNANIYATAAILNVLVTGDILGGITALGKGTGEALGNLHVYGGIRDGSLVLDGSVGSIVVNGTLGTSTGSLYVAGSAKLISVGANTRQKGSSLALALHVMGNIGTLRVHGTITGSVTAGGDIDNLTVTGDGTTPNVITSPISVGGRLYKAVISNGSVDANITANGFINAFTISHGSLLYGATVQSVLDSIHSFNITGGANYGLFGSLLATNGTAFSMNISGNVGDGTDPVTISANSGSNIIVNGTISDHTTITIADELKLLEVNGDIQSGVTISANPLVTQKIKGTNDGNINIV